MPCDGDRPEYGRFTKRLRGTNGISIGTANDNTILHSRVYEVEYPNGHKTALAANVIAINMFAKIDSKGKCHVMFD